jgi:hypothetical protein
VVVGMVKSIARGDPGQQPGATAMGVPVEVIRTLCPELWLPAGCPYRGRGCLLRQGWLRFGEMTKLPQAVALGQF